MEGVKGGLGQGLEGSGLRLRAPGAATLRTTSRSCEQNLQPNQAKLGTHMS